MTENARKKCDCMQLEIFASTTTFSFTISSCGVAAKTKARDSVENIIPIKDIQKYILAYTTEELTF